jgi:hypothetical protein
MALFNHRRPELRKQLAKTSEGLTILSVPAAKGEVAQIGGQVNISG